MNFKPYGDKIVVKSIKKEKTESGLYIPETEDMAHLMKGEVVAISDGFVLGDKEWPVTSRIGDIVVFQKGVGVKISIEDEEYLILQESTVFGKEETVEERQKQFEDEEKRLLITGGIPPEKDKKD